MIKLQTMMYKPEEKKIQSFMDYCNENIFARKSNANGANECDTNSHLRKR